MLFGLNLEFEQCYLNIVIHFNAMGNLYNAIRLEYNIVKCYLNEPCIMHLNEIGMLFGRHLNAIWNFSNGI